MFEASNDRGQTWGPQIRVNSQGGSAQQVGPWQIPIPAMNVDPNSGGIAIAWPDSRNGNQDILFAYSTDGGATWGTNHKINDDAGSTSQWMVDLAIDSTGKVHAAWEDGRTGAWNIFYANSTDRGATWTTNLRVSSEDTSARTTVRATISRSSRDPTITFTSSGRTAVAKTSTSTMRGTPAFRAPRSRLRRTPQDSRCKSTGLHTPVPPRKLS